MELEAKAKATSVARRLSTLRETEDDEPPVRQITEGEFPAEIARFEAARCEECGVARARRLEDDVAHVGVFLEALDALERRLVAVAGGESEPARMIYAIRERRDLLGRSGG